MPLEKIIDRVYSVGAQHPDRELFDAFMPLHYGTTYNSYYIQGSAATALIDPVDPEKLSQLLHALNELKVEKVDYIINLHTEQDHSGGTVYLLDRWPDAKLVGSVKVAELAASHLHIDPSSYQIVKDGDELSLGDKTLVFKTVPFAHWPDNTTAYLKEDRILFSSDLFGNHLACGTLFNQDLERQKEAARAYYAEIMMPFRTQCKKYAEYFRALDPVMIAPAHGPLWQNPADILDLYDQWAGDYYDRQVVIGYVSMHESTWEMVQRLVLRLNQMGIPYSLHNLGAHRDSMSVEVGMMAAELVTAPIFVLASPTVLTNPHPAAMYASVVVDILKPKVKYFGFMGSYGWATKAPKTIEAVTPNLTKVERLEPLMVKGSPTVEDYAQIDAYAELLAAKLDEVCPLEA